MRTFGCPLWANSGHWQTEPLGPLGRSITAMELRSRYGGRLA